MPKEVNIARREVARQKQYSHDDPYAPDVNEEQFFFGSYDLTHDEPRGLCLNLYLKFYQREQEKLLGLKPRSRVNATFTHYEGLHC